MNVSTQELPGFGFRVLCQADGRLKTFAQVQQRIILMSRVWWIKPEGFISNGMDGTSFGRTARAAAKALQQTGYRYDQRLKVDHRSGEQRGSRP